MPDEFEALLEKELEGAIPVEQENANPPPGQGNSNNENSPEIEIAGLGNGELDQDFLDDVEAAGAALKPEDKPQDEKPASSQEGNSEGEAKPESENESESEKPEEEKPSDKPPSPSPPPPVPQNIDLDKLIKICVEKTTDNMEPIVKEEIETALKVALASLRPIQIKIGTRPAVILNERLHKAFKEVLFLATQEKQVMMQGPAGTGKTTLGEQIGKALKLPFAFISCSAGMSEAHLLGRMLFDGTYIMSDFIKCYETGGVFLFDEIDAADANTLLVINSGLANDKVSVPNRKENSIAKRHKDFICLVSGNSWGYGSVEYQGRGYLDAAFLDRFALSKVEVDYDVSLEKDISSEYPIIAETFWKLRTNTKEGNVRRIVSTRAIVSGTRQMKAGKPMSAILKTFFLSWTKEEIAKARKDLPTLPTESK